MKSTAIGAFSVHFQINQLSATHGTDPFIKTAVLTVVCTVQLAGFGAYLALSKFVCRGDLPFYMMEITTIIESSKPS